MVEFAEHTEFEFHHLVKVVDRERGVHENPHCKHELRIPAHAGGSPDESQRKRSQYEQRKDGDPDRVVIPGVSLPLALPTVRAIRKVWVEWPAAFPAKGD